MERATHLLSSLLPGRLTSCSAPPGGLPLTERRRRMKRRTQLQVLVSVTGSGEHARGKWLYMVIYILIQVEKTNASCSPEPCAIMPPLEIFMEVSYEERRAMLYRDLERGDVVIGRINNIREYGFFLTLLCTAVGLKRDIEDLELSVGAAGTNLTPVYVPCSKNVCIWVSLVRQDSSVHPSSIHSSLHLCSHLYRRCVTLEKSPPLAAMMILCPTTRLGT